MGDQKGLLEKKWASWDWPRETASWHTEKKSFTNGGVPMSFFLRKKIS
jgi:hypothetical protein